MVAPFENLTNDTAFALVGRMAADFITDGVSRLDSVEVVLSSDVLTLAGKRPGGAQANRQLAEQLHASTLLTGGFYKQGDSLRFQVRQLDVASGKVIQTMDLAGPASDPMVGIRLLRDRLMGSFAAADNGGVVLRGAAAPAYDAYKEFLRGGERFNHGDYQGAIPFLTKAVALDSTFGIAFATLAAAYGNFGHMAEADSVAKIASRYRDRFPESHRAVFDYTLGTIAEEREAMFRLAQSQAVRDSGFFWLFLTGANGVGINRPTAGAKALRAIAEVPEGWFPYWRFLATAYHQLEDFDRELQTAERANMLYPTRMGVHRLRALAARGELKLISAIIDSIARVSTDTTFTPADYMLTTARELRVHGRESESADMLKRARGWLAGRPQQEFQARRSSRRTLANVLFAMRQFDSAQTRYAELAASDATDIAARARVGTSAALRGDSATARKVAVDLSRLALPYKKGETLYWRAVLAASLGERESAARLLEQAAARGQGFSDLSAHRQEEFLPLRADEAFAAVMRPKG
jgi:tetratricopeptide (TPR) repeat protein